MGDEANQIDKLKQLQSGTAAIGKDGSGALSRLFPFSSVTLAGCWNRPS
jgi:hypothetical protein